MKAFQISTINEIWKIYKNVMFKKVVIVKISLKLIKNDIKTFNLYFLNLLDAFDLEDA